MVKRSQSERRRYLIAKLNHIQALAQTLHLYFQFPQIIKESLNLGSIIIDGVEMLFKHLTDLFKVHTFIYLFSSIKAAALLSCHPFKPCEKRFCTNLNTFRFPEFTGKW